MRSKTPPRRDVPFFVDVGIALALVLTTTFFVIVMENYFAPGAFARALQMMPDGNVPVAPDPTKNKAD